jgi:hypothetical protein
MDNVFGQPDNMQPENVEKEGNNPTLIVILLILILGGGAALGFLLYRQSQEEPVVLDEVVETVELPEGAIPEITDSIPATGLDESIEVDDTSSIVEEPILPVE